MYKRLIKISKCNDDCIREFSVSIDTRDLAIPLGVYFYSDKKCIHLLCFMIEYSKFKPIDCGCNVVNEVEK